MPRHSRDLKLERFWRHHLGRQPASGLTVREYCRQHALREPSFYNWRRILLERDRQHPSTLPKVAARSAAPAFVPVAIVEQAARHDDTPIDIQFPNGSRIHVRSGCDRTLLADVVSLLSASPKSEARSC